MARVVVFSDAGSVAVDVTEWVDDEGDSLYEPACRDCPWRVVAGTDGYDPSDLTNRDLMMQTAESHDDEPHEERS